jgi:hypothetical protein
MVSLSRSAAIPLAIVVFGLVALTEPSGLVRSALLIFGVSAAGLTLLAAASWWQASGQSRLKRARAEGPPVAAEDAEDRARMDSDAG